MTESAQKLLAAFRKISKEKNTTPQLVMQYFMLERFLERVALSRYRDHYVVKGGFLIASLVGLENRATRDIDATITNFQLDEDTILEMMEDVIEIDINDGISFSLERIKEIREHDQYNGYRASLIANYPPISVPFKLDISAGDAITPRAIDYSHHLMIESRSISIKAYDVNAVLAEKLETIVSRGNANTRLRDYYDVYILTKFEAYKINIETLKRAIITTSSRRDSLIKLNNYHYVMKEIRETPIMHEQWKEYRRKNEYAQSISFDDVYEATLNLLDSLFDEPRK